MNIKFGKNQEFSSSKIKNKCIILKDVSQSGKEREWRDHKLDSLQLAKSFERLVLRKLEDSSFINKLDRVSRCGSYLKFRECADKHKKLFEAYFCKVRLCPMCAWRKSLVLFHQLRDILHEVLIQRDQKVRFLFLTLTCKNISGDKLSNSISLLFDAWDRFSRRSFFKKAVLGWFRVLEVTYNPETDEYHPHFHIILAVPPSYFSRNYIKHEDWALYWQESLRVDYIPMVNIQAIKSNSRRKNKPIEAVAAEAGKYVVKPGDYLFDDKDVTDRVVQVFDEALAHRRLVTFGGLFKEIRRQLKQVDIEKANLVKLKEKEESNNCCCDICGMLTEEVLYRWQGQIGLTNYVRSDK